MSENNCTFVSSRGILKSTNIHSNNPISSCSIVHDYLANCIKCNPNDSVYICSSAILHFIPHINKLIEVKSSWTITLDNDKIIAKCEKIYSIDQKGFVVLR